jgi:hypothetical protein
MTARCLPVLLTLAAACTPKIQEEYTVEIVGQPDQDYLMGATKAVLEVNDKVVATTSISPGRSFSLTGKGIDTTMTPSAVFRVKALDAKDAVVSVGESPQIELELASPPVVRVFMQRAGTVGRHADLDYPRRGMVAVAAPGTVPIDSRAKPITVAFFGLGTVVVKDTNENPVERPSEVLQFYNPVTQFIDDAGTAGNPGGMPHPRVSAGITVHPDGRVLIFGGEVTVGTDPPAPSAQLDVVKIERTDFDAFTASLLFREPTMAGLARIAPVMVYTDAAYAIGGRAGAPLDTIAVINPDLDDGFRLLPQHMAGPRDGHTATVVNISGGRDVLIFGGAPTGVAVAEVLSPPGPMLINPTGDDGGARRDHGAVLLPPGDRVLILGGRGDAGVRGDTVLYQAGSHTLAPGPITLKRPRAEMAAFVVGDDLVVVGGVDNTGAFVTTAEVYSATTLQPKNLDVPCVGRSGAAVVVLPNHLAMLLGGTEADMKTGMPKASSVVETYQPIPK